jgi:aminoglycoside phosphotransferase
MAKFTITTTPKGWFRVETRFQRLGTYKTKGAAEAAIQNEQARLDFFKSAALAAPQTYEGQMAAQAEAERQWKSRP